MTKMTKMTKNIKAALGLFIITLLGYLVQFGLNTFLARHLTEAIYGDFNLAIKILTIFVAVTLFGSNVGANRFLAKFIKQHDVKTASDYIAWNTKLLSLTFLISFIITLIAFTTMMLLHVYGVKNINHYHLVVYTLWLFPFGSLTLLLVSYLSSANQVLIGNFLYNAMLYIVQIIMFILMTLYIDPTLHNSSIIFSLFISYLIVSTIAIFSMNQRLFNLLLPSIKRYKTTLLTERKSTWLNTSSRLTVNGMIYALICAIDLLIVDLLSKYAADTGLYSAALIITNFLWLIFRGFYNQLKSNISTLITTAKKRIELQKSLNTINLISFFFLIIAITSIMLFEKPLLLLFGPTYLKAETVVTLLCFSRLFGNYADLASRLIVLGGQEKTLLKLTTIELFVSVLFMIPLTFFYGIVGTAIGALATSIIKLIINIFLCRRSLGIRLLYFV